VLEPVAAGQQLDELLVVRDDDQLEVAVLGLPAGDLGEGQRQALDVLPATNSGMRSHV